MSQVKRDEMTILRSASDAAATATSAEDDIQLQSVAYCINEASNTGLYRTVFQQPLRDSVKSQLEAKGYTIKYINNNSYNMEHHALIIWGPTNPGDLIDEPSMNGPSSTIARGAAAAFAEANAELAAYSAELEDEVEGLQEVDVDGEEDTAETDNNDEPETEQAEEIEETE